MTLFVARVPTPALQAYWIELPDKRAASVWIALDESTLDNGCMWYGAGTHTQPLRLQLVLPGERLGRGRRGLGRTRF